MGADGHASEAGQAVRKLVAAAIFGEFATGAEVADPELPAEQGRRDRHQPAAAQDSPRPVRLLSASVTVGLKRYLAKTGRRNLPAEIGVRRPSGRALTLVSFRP